MSHQHAVWPTSVPPVSTACWSSESWQKFEDGYKPKDYTGGRHDTAAWNAYAKTVKARVDEEIRQPFYKALILSHGQTEADRWLEANRAANA